MKPPINRYTRKVAEKAQKKQTRKKVVKTSLIGGAITGISGAAVKASNMLNPEPITEIKNRIKPLPDGGNIAQDMYEKVAAAVPPIHEVLSSAADFGLKAGVAGALISGALKANSELKKRKNSNLNDWQNF